MVIEVEVIGNGRYAGAKSNIASYSVSEESTPIEASDSSGGTGQINFNAVDDPSRLGSILLLNDTVKLTDGDRGDTQGKINAMNGSDGLLSITADSRLGQLVVDVTAGPINGTFSTAINYYLGLGNITTGIAIDSSLSSIPVVVPGWTGDLWTKIKELCVFVGAEISLLKGNVAVRPFRQRNALEINNISEAWSVSNTEMARRVEVYYYNSTYKTNEMVYPKGGWDEDVNVYTVDSGQTVEVNIPVDVSFVSLQQPTVQLFVGRYYTGPTSVYAVAGNDGLPIQPQQWTDGGGGVTVAIGEDKKSIDLKIVGASGDVARYAPFRIAVSAGPSDYYSALRIVGTGMHFEQNSVIVPTGVDPAATARDVGVTVDNVFVKTYAQALDVALNVSAKWASPSRTVSFQKASINKAKDTSSNLDFATFDDFTAYAAANGITTFDQFNTAWNGKTFDEFDDYWYSLVETSFGYQVFGNAVGARLQWRRAFYRIRSTNITEVGIDIGAEADTTFDDFNTSMLGAPTTMTFNDFNTLYAGLTFDDFNLIPLPYVKPEYDRA